uniref:Uncharacterized protein n=1 Tax=Arundo donax TaxID=35708 RepID=A0A0A9AZ19_ARUDO
MCISHMIKILLSTQDY